MSRRGPTLRAVKGGRYAEARFSGRSYSFGRWDDPDSHRRFDQFKAMWRANDERVTDEMVSWLRGRGRTVSGEPVTSVQELCDGYLAQKRPDDRIRTTLALVCDLFGPLPANEFDSIALKKVRERILERGHIRPEINRRVIEIRSCFRWGVEAKIVSGAVLEELKAVSALKKRQTKAPERKKKRIPTQAELDAVIAELPAPYDALLRFLSLTGARVKEALSMLSNDIEQHDDGVWTVVLHEHKTDWHEGSEAREIAVGPRCQELLAPYLERDGRVFAEAPDPTEDRYAHNTVHQFVSRACKRAGVEHFPPSAMRHFVLNSIDDPLQAQAVAGHARLDQQAVYRRTRGQQAREWAMKHG